MTKKLATYILFYFSTCSAEAQMTSTGLDLSFGNNGIVIDSYANGDYKIAYDVTVQPDDKILVAGNVVSRYLSSGVLDSSFGGTGNMSTSVLTNISGAVASNLCLQPDNKIVISGDSDSGAFVLRLTPNGTLDSEFAKNGLFRHCCPIGTESSVLQPDGRILISGQVNNNISVFRLQSSGQMDSSFGLNGVVLVPNGKYQGNVGAIRLLSDGRMIVAGIGYDLFDNRSAFVLRIMPDGTLDTTLNHTGFIHPFVTDYCWDMIVQQDGKLLIPFYGLSNGSHIARLQINGDIDSSFGSFGISALPSMKVEAIRQLSDKKIVCGGSDGDFMIARLGNDGKSLDSSFGDFGVIRTDVSGYTDDRIHAIALQQDAKIIAVGESRTSNLSSPRLTIVRYLRDAVMSIGNAKTEPFVIAPNPVTDHLRIDVSEGIKTCKYQVFGADGKLLKSGILEGEHFVLPAIDLKPGNYILRVFNQKYSVSGIITKL